LASAAMPGVLRTPRTVPPLNPQAMKAAQAVALNDEVAQILKGLKLDKKFFFDRIEAKALQDLAPPVPNNDDLVSSNDAAGRDRQRESIRRTRKRITMQMKGAQKASADFDIYLNEAVMPVLAQALDALCRQLSRMQQQGDSLDPKVRARFNPLTWLGQQLLRRHPKCARTPRRQLLYRSFKDWSDFEKGRREMLRRRDPVNEIFNGFMLRGVVEYSTIWDVITSVDDTLCLEGVLKNSIDLERAMRGEGVTVPNQPNRFQKGCSWTFEEFWYYFGTTIMRHDIVPFTVIRRGIDKRAKELEEQREWAKKMEEADAEKQRQEDEKRRLTQEYAVLYDKIMVDPHVNSILGEGKILTGDDVRQGDLGYELEVPPHGPHISLLADLLVLLGLEGAQQQESEELEEPMTPTKSGHGIFRSSAKAQQIAGAQEEERYWDDKLAHAWATLQRVHRADIADGVVDQDILSKVLVPPVGFNLLKAKVEDEIERKEERGDDDDDEDIASGRVLQSSEKPTMEQLAQRLGMTMARLDWLHKLFESFLLPDPDAGPDAPAPCCLYPDCPASITKEQMRVLVSEVEPSLSKAQFDARFKRLDQDGSGLIEFDEFAMWVHSSDVRVAGNAAVKMTFEEIANRYQEPVDLIKYLYTVFVDQLPDGVEDDYPDEPVGLPKQEAKFLAGIVTPGFNAAEFDANFAIVDAHSRQAGHCDFDEFIELLEFDDLPTELREKFDAA